MESKPASFAPIKFKELLEKLKQKFFTASLDWQLYRQLYREKPERIELLNKAAPLLFGRVQKHLFIGVVLALSRLTDPALGRKPKKGEEQKEFNLSIDLLVSEIERADPVFGAKLRADLNAMQEDIAKLHLVRNKRLVHNDFGHETDDREGPAFDRINYEFIADLLSRLHGLLNRAEIYYCEAETGYDFPMTHGFGDGEWFAWLLKIAFAQGDPRQNRGWERP